MIFNKKGIIVPLATLLLLASFHTASAFSFKKVFSDIFGNNKIETQSAASFEAVDNTKSTDTTVVTPTKDSVPIDITPTKDQSTPILTPSLKIDEPQIQPVDTDKIKEIDVILKYGMKANSNVKLLQNRLKVLGYLNGTVDGNYGKGTVLSVSKLKSDNNIVADGTIVGTVTLKKLNLKLPKGKPNSPNDVGDILFLGGENLTPSNYNDVYLSTDMQGWSPISPNDPNSTTKWLPRKNMETVFFNNKYWVIGGTDSQGNIYNDVWWSSDGSSWTLATSNPPFSGYVEYHALVLNNKIYIIDGVTPGGGENQPMKIWSSSDGINWVTVLNNAPYGTRQGEVVTAYNGNIYVIGGYHYTTLNTTLLYDVWSSSDGSGWVNLTNSSGINSQQASPLIYNNKIYLVGGHSFSGGGPSPYIYSSSDGITWTLVNNSFNIGNAVADAIVSNNKMWVGDWQGLSGSQNNLWSSSDGITWTQSNTTVPWSPRFGYRFVNNNTPPSIYQCSDGIDNDGDGYIDYPSDLGCTSLTDNDEYNVPQTVTITSPNGGEVYAQGQQMNMTWTSTGYSANSLVNIDLSVHTAGGYSNTFLMSYTGLANDGSETLPIPLNVPNATNYAMHITAYEPGSPYFISDNSDGDFTITSQTPQTCLINSFTVPVTTTVASGLSVTTSWSSNCNSVVLEANSGSYTLRYVGGSSGTHTFSMGPGSSVSTADNSIDITLIAGNATDTISQTKSVSISDITSPASNQCQFSSLTATPNPIPSGSSQTTLSWVAPTGCIVYIESWTPSSGGLTTAHIFNPGTYYFPSTGSVNVTLSKSSTYYLSAQAGTGGNNMVLSAKTIDVKKQ
jgi:hypothetical protein